MRSSVSIYACLSRSARPPQPSFWRSVVKKLVPGKRMTSTPPSARRTLSISPCAKVVPTWPSTVTKSSSDASSACSVTSTLDGRITGRMASVCADTGVTTIVSSVGKTTGPPAERLYAVDPVGVDSTMPSAA